MFIHISYIKREKRNVAHVSPSVIGRTKEEKKFATVTAILVTVALLYQFFFFFLGFVLLGWRAFARALC